jgi:riboflavin kinase/FMN adenylyltransferase
MRLIRSSNQLPELKQQTIASIGNFDGFHLGHQAILRYASEQAREQQAKLVLLSFEPTAKEFFLRERAPARIYTLRQKLELAQAYAVDYFVCLRFNQQLANMPATDFIREILFKDLNIQHLVVGDDFRFGHQRIGDLALLETMGAELGFTVQDCRTLLHGESRVSSSAIREKLQAGRFDLVESLLGRAFSIKGKVFHGDKRGRAIGFPTANILLRRKVLPIRGVFVVTASNGQNHWQGVANVGNRPTVNGQRNQLEVHCFDCTEDLYGQNLDVTFLHKLRDEKKFSSFEALKHQISLDVESAQTYFNQ